ncbi:MAG: DUF4157 domain-containing protein [Myxococcota bacterium]
MTREQEREAAAEVAAPRTAQGPARSTADMRSRLRGLSFREGAEALQPKASGDLQQDAVGLARQGFRGPSSDLPHRGAIEQSLGTDLSGVRAHSGPDAAAACGRLGAEAYAMGERVAFASPSPSKHVAAHEAAHVVQQSRGVQLSGKVGRAGDDYERQADAAADRVVAGESARDVLDAPAKVAPGSDGPVQRYTTQSLSGEPHRVSDDGRMAVYQESVYGSQVAYAEPGMIEAASSKLEAATSVMRLEPGDYDVEAHAEDGSKRALSDVVVTNTANDTKDSDMVLWADCGRAGRAVSGGDRGTGTGQGDMVARYEAPSGEGKKVSKTHWPEIQKAVIMTEHFSDELDMAAVSAKAKAYYETRAALEKETDPGKRKALSSKRARLAAEIDVITRAAYEKLSDEDKRAFDEKVGINAYADPEIGEAFHISTGGGRHPEAPEGLMTWNFHWAGVVLKSGSDTVTLENYSVGEYGAENSSWVYQLYGVGKKKDQSFHEQHKDVHKQHGASPTTMRMGKP